jgi:hypothetical protein
VLPDSGGGRMAPTSVALPVERNAELLALKA